MNRYYYAYEKLLTALDSLATGAGDVRERLLNAFWSFHPLKEEHFPANLQADYRWVMKELTKFGPVLDHAGAVRVGSVENTLKRIRRTTGVKIAERLLHLYHELESMHRNDGLA